MGLGKFWMKHGPGSLGSLAKTMTKVYLTNKLRFPMLSNEQLLAITLETRIRAHGKEGYILHPRDEKGETITELELVRQKNWNLNELILHVAHREIGELNNARFNFPELYEQATEIVDEIVNKHLGSEYIAMTSKIIIDCPICKQKLRVPAEQSLQVNCPGCKSSFDYPFNHYDTDSDYYENEDLDDIEAESESTVTAKDSEEDDYDIEACKQAIRINPDDANAHNNLGYAYGQSGMYEEAIESNKQAIRIEPVHVQAHFDLGLAYIKLGKYKEAIESFNQEIRINPDEAASHLLLGSAYFESGMHKEAIESYKQAIRINPDDAGAHYNLGYAYVLLNDRDSALEEYRILKGIDTEWANNLFNVIYE